MKPTTEQADIINAKSGNLLVSAAAGSGKTTVMTERIVARILKRELSVDRMLVMTFTNAAAANMSAKLEEKLRAVLAQTTDRETRKYLSGQIAMLPSAFISTIDAFCVKVIGSFSAQARDEKGDLLIEPQSTILDETHKAILLRESFDEVFAEAYLLAERTDEDAAWASEPMVSGEDGTWPCALLDTGVTRKEWAEQFITMATSLGTGRDDGSLKEDMMRKLDYLRSLPSYRQWMIENLQRKKEEVDDPLSAPFYGRVMETLRTLIEERLPSVRMNLMHVDDVIFVKDKKNCEQRVKDWKEWLLFVIEMGEYILRAPDPKWDDLVALSARKPSEKLPEAKRSKNCDASLSDFIEELGPFYELAYMLTGVKKNEDLFKMVNKYFRFFFGKTEAELKEEARSLFPVLLRYFEVVLAADERYAEKKRKESSLDFTDQEQMALMLLSKEEVAAYYRELFDEIYIDEYQDNSGVQDAIVQCFARNNVFFVGDVKQSIYRFRHAKPQMFLDRCEKYGGKEGGTLYTLKDNFRSVPGVLTIANEVFSEIMGKDFADIEYDGTHALNPGLSPEKYVETSGSPVTVIIAEDDWDAEKKTEPDGKNGVRQDEDTDDPEEQNVRNVEKESLIIGNKIRELSQLPGFSYKDCAILTTTNEAAMKAADMLCACGIPARGPYLGNILQHPDLRVMIDLARITDNMLVDIPLAAVMKSDLPKARFSDRDLLAMRLFADEKKQKGLLFCEKVQYFADHAEGELAKKVQEFLSFINDLRTWAMQMSMTKWLEHVYAATDYPKTVRSGRNGEERYFALMSLAEWAARFDTARRSGLRAFVEYIEEMDAQKDSKTEIELSASLENVVRCMTIHKSKGLEFPYVFLCGLQSSPRTDSSPVRLNEKGEMAAICYRPEWQARYEPHDFFVLSVEDRRETEAEKIRLLYVAMTRAEKKLFVVAVVKRSKEDSISGCGWVDEVLACPPGKKLPYTTMWKLGSHFQRLLAALIRRNPSWVTPVLHQVEVAEGDLDFASPDPKPGRPDLALLVSGGKSMAASVVEEGTSDKDVYEEARKVDVEEVLTPEEKKRLSMLSADDEKWAELHLIPAKSTVSEMQRLMNKEETDDDTEETTLEAVNMRVHESAEKWKGAGYTATELGTLLHSAWQYLDFPGIRNRGLSPDWESELRKLCEYGMISKDQVDVLLPFSPCMQKFLDSDVCASITLAEEDGGRGPFREIPFALACLYKTETGDGAAASGEVSGHEYTLVQGMIDCWFIDTDGEAVLIDYKSDRIRGSLEEKTEEVAKRHKKQIDMYAEAITAATGKTVKRKIIWLIRDGLAIDI
ncbi:MAG: UvrD-helicase domain-containing protein [Clostridiales bacterium]|nr:UvrD-helicase domain-containing protein [Clostridiales bacterium]